MAARLIEADWTKFVGILNMRWHQPIARLILGAEFADAAPLLLIMIPGSFITASVSVLTVLPTGVGRVGPSLAGSAAGFLASAAAWLVPRYGAAGAAWGNTMYFIVFVIVLIPFIISILRQSHRI